MTQPTRIPGKLLFKTLEFLEQDYWKDTEENSYLITTCAQLRKKQLKYFEPEDLRIMIGQNISLAYLIPLALQTLNENILVSGHFYPGDLLYVVLKSDAAYWKKEPVNHAFMCSIFQNNRHRLEETDTLERIRSGWFEAFDEFAKVTNA